MNIVAWIKKNFIPYLFRFSLLGVGIGLTLIVEHLITYGRFDPEMGHEWLGLLILVISMIINVVVTKKDKNKGT